MDLLAIIFGFVLACLGMLHIWLCLRDSKPFPAATVAPALSPLAEKLLTVFADDGRPWEVTFAGSLRCGTLLASRWGQVMVHSTHLSDGLTEGERRKVAAAVRDRIRLVSYDERCESMDDWLSNNVAPAPHAAYHLGDD
jgi:hypothetical protein